MLYRLVETHAHLDEIGDLEETIAQAMQASLVAVIAVGSNYESNSKTLTLAQQYKGFIYPALGLHPWNLGDADIERNLEYIEANIDKAVAIGEIGLDYDKRVKARADKDLQARVFRKLLAIGKKHEKPVIIHSRYAWRDALNLVDEAELENVVFHWFTGPSSVLRDIIAKCYFLSATQAIEYHGEHRRVVRETPLERLLLETDSPVTYRRGTEFEYSARPAHVLRVLKEVANLTGVDEAHIADITTANADALFGLNLS